MLVGKVVCCSVRSQDTNQVGIFLRPIPAKRDLGLSIRGGPASACPVRAISWRANGSRSRAPEDFHEASLLVENAFPFHSCVAFSLYVFEPISSSKLPF